MEFNERAGRTAVADARHCAKYKLMLIVDEKDRHPQSPG